MATAAQKFELFLEELDAYTVAGGDAAVPQKALGRPDEKGKPYPIGRRAAYMRVRYAEGNLTPEQIQMLQERDGWVWDLADARWHEQYEAVAAYLQEHGGYEGIPRALSEWVRRAKQALLEDQLPADKAALVRSLPTRGGVDRFCAIALTWLAAHPRKTLADVPAGTVVEFEGKPFKLAKAIWYYRRRGAGLEGSRPMSSEDRMALETLPGWDWGNPLEIEHHDPQD